MCENKILDVLIIGAGPIGLACGIEAEKNGLSYQIVDKGKLVNSIYNYPHGMRFFSSSEKLEIGGVPFISHTHKPTRAEALEYYRRVAMSWDLNITLYNKVESVEKENDLFRVKTAKGTYTAQSVVIATGFYDLPHKMGVPGEELSKVMHYYKEPHPFFGQNLAVVGASNSAVDAALECYRKGAKVTMIVRGEEIGRRVKYWVKPDIENRIAEGSIKALFNSQIDEIKEDSIKVDHNGEKIELENDFVLALTGYEPNYSFLEEMGITFSKDGKRVPTHDTETMETNIDNIFLAAQVVH
jgi:thioredoxin reductase (NADPH)